MECSQDKSLECSQDKSLRKEPVLPSASIDRRKQPHVLPLVEYGAQGKYVVISPEEGLLAFEPDSPEWFTWLSTLPSFRFVGEPGRFTAFRGYQCSANTRLLGSSPDPQPFLQASSGHDGVCDD